MPGEALSCRRMLALGVAFRNRLYVTRTATAQLNWHAQPWVWGRPPPLPRYLRRCFVYRL